MQSRGSYDSAFEDAADEVLEQRATQRLLGKQAEEVVNVAAEHGIIERVECYNFMCHEHFSVELGPLINFIVGKNGSGKSAVLTALTLCLGGKASATNRGQWWGQLRFLTALYPQVRDYHSPTQKSG